jgi:uncharacterized protein YaaN involved in tellurite resistance
MTEQNYADPGQAAPEAMQASVGQLDTALQRIAVLEQQVHDLQHQLALAQGGVTTFPAA